MKKFLSMALALVMAFSLCAAFTTQKADAAFTDSADLSNEYAVQAADVIKVIEVMDGYEDGSFRPTAGLTRQAAAKIICNMILGPTTAKALPTNANPFPDVPAGNQFAGYISYCSQQGIISGYSDGTFKPTDPLSGYAYLKMLLGALGYDANNEGFVGDNWKVNVAKIALGIGLSNGMSEELDGAMQVTREVAAICAFNTLQADMVEYESKNTLEINGVKVSMGGGKAVPQTWSTSSTNANNISGATDNGAPIVQFAERYFEKLERFPNGSLNNPPTNGRDEYVHDPLGRPSIVWTWKGVDVKDTDNGCYQKEADLTYVGNVSGNTIHSDLGMSSSSEPWAEIYLNGRYAGMVQIAKSNGNDINDTKKRTFNATGALADITDKIGDGTIVKVYHNDADNSVTISVMNVWAGKVTNVKAATSTKNERIVLDVGKYGEDTPAGTRQDNRLSRPNDMTTPTKREYELPEADEGKYEEDDVVAFLYSESWEEIEEILYVLEPVEGTLTRRYDDKSLVLDGTTYKYAKNLHFDFSGTTGSTKDESGLTTKNDYIAYLDENDLVLWVEESAFTDDQYALVERIWLEHSNGVDVISQAIQSDGTVPPAKDNESGSISAPRARLRFTSGSYRDVNLNESEAYRTEDNVPDATEPSGLRHVEGVKVGYQPGSLIRFTTTSDGDYKLHTVKGRNDTTYGGVSYTGTKNDVDQYAVIDNMLRGFQTDDGLVSADSSTKFIISDNGTYKTYTGIRNVPNVSNVKYGAAYCKSTLAKVVFLVSGEDGVTGSKNDIVFISAPSVSKRIDDDDYAPHYEYNAVVKNQVTTIRVAVYENAASDGTDDDLLKLENSWNKVQTGKSDKNLCVVLSKTSYDGDDVLKSGKFEGGTHSLLSYRAQGIKRVSGSIVDIKLDTATNSEKNLSMDENIRVYFSDKDGNIEEIDVADIVTDGNDWIYYVIDNGDITYMFIQEVDEEDDDDIVETKTYNPNDQEVVDFWHTREGYVVKLANGAKTISADSYVYFTVHPAEGEPGYTEDDVTYNGVRFTYLNRNKDRLSLTAQDTGAGVWRVRVPSANEMAENPEFQIRVTL